MCTREKVLLGLVAAVCITCAWTAASLQKERSETEKAVIEVLETAITQQRIDATVQINMLYPKYAKAAATSGQQGEDSPAQMLKNVLYEDALTILACEVQYRMLYQQLDTPDYAINECIAVKKAHPALFRDALREAAGSPLHMTLESYYNHSFMERYTRIPTPIPEEIFDEILEGIEQ